MNAQRPPIRFKSNARAAQKSLPGNAKSGCVGENYETRSGKIRRVLRLDGATWKVTAPGVEDAPDGAAPLGIGYWKLVIEKQERGHYLYSG